MPGKNINGRFSFLANQLITQNRFSSSRTAKLVAGTRQRCEGFSSKVRHNRLSVLFTMGRYGPRVFKPETMGDGKPQRINTVSRSPSGAVLTIGAMQLGKIADSGAIFPTRLCTPFKKSRISSGPFVMLYKLHIETRSLPNLEASPTANG